MGFLRQSFGLLRASEGRMTVSNFWASARRFGVNASAVPQSADVPEPERMAKIARRKRVAVTGDPARRGADGASSARGKSQGVAAQNTPPHNSAPDFRHDPCMKSAGCALFKPQARQSPVSLRTSAAGRSPARRGRGQPWARYAQRVPPRDRQTNRQNPRAPCRRTTAVRRPHPHPAGPEVHRRPPERPRGASGPSCPTSDTSAPCAGLRQSGHGAGSGNASRAG